MAAVEGTVSGDGGMRGRPGRVAVVTGGASGIGRATCLALIGTSANVVVVDVNRELVEQTVHAARAIGGVAEGLVLDVRREADMEEMARRTMDRFGRIDILVASAGILRARGSSPKPLVQVTSEEWDQVLDTNLKGMFLSNRAVLPAMIKQHSGDIVNLSSVSGKQGRAHDGPYCASKFGVIGMSESLAEEVRPHGVRVQIVVPDAVNTAIWDQNGPVPRPANALPPERVADLIVHLVSLPEDTMLMGTVIMPFRARRRVAAPVAPLDR